MFHQIGSRSGWKHLEVGAVRLAREQVRGDLRLLVVRELDAVDVCATAAMRRQFVGPPAQEASKLQTSIAPASIRSRQPSGEYSLWPAQTGMPPPMRARRACRGASLRPAARLLEPADVEVLHALAELERLRGV